MTVARERLQQHPELRDVAVELVDRTYEEAIAAAVERTGARRIGIEAAAMTVSQFERLAGALGRHQNAVAGSAPAARLVPAERIVERTRLVKDPSEIARLRIAARMLSEVANGVPSLVRAGLTEREVAGGIDAALRGVGFERAAFETIVASGPNSALPHARPGGRRLSPGDGVVLDFGGVYDGYCVDLTRTVQLAPMTDVFGRLFGAVVAAHRAAIAAVQPGVKASDIDAAARETLRQHGLADAFLHGTGHGLGLEVHEEPRIGRAGAGDRDQTLEPGMVFTIEPGVYVDGLGGVRIEDDVLVVQGGCEILTDVPIQRTM
jgi:Xaa-Pro aminopeptidase